MTLTPKMRQALKSRAHKMKPVILVGSNGISEALLKETEVVVMTSVMKNEISNNIKATRIIEAQSRSALIQQGKVALGHLLLAGLDLLPPEDPLLCQVLHKVISTSATIFRETDQNLLPWFDWVQSKKIIVVLHQLLVIVLLI